MTIIISTTVGGQTVSTTEPLLVTQTGVIDDERGIDFVTGSKPGLAIVAGSVTGNFRGAILNGDDQLTITSAGFVGGMGDSGADGASTFGINNTIAVQGMLFGRDIGFFAAPGSEALVTVSQSGVIQGGSNVGGLETTAYSAAIASASTAPVVIKNAGTILGDLNPDNGLRIAILNASIDASSATGFDTSLVSDMVVKNSGTIVGDIMLGAGADVYDSLGGGIVDGMISMGLGNDFVRGGSAVDDVKGGDGDDMMRGGRGNDSLFGGNGNDTIRGGRDDDLLNGGANGDSLLGGAGEDELRGGDGADTINGGSDDDLLRGGQGFDTFVFSGSFGVDVIGDFNASNNEKIDVSAIASISDFDDLQNNHLTQVGADSVIDDGAGNQIVIEGFVADHLNPGDFIF